MKTRETNGTLENAVRNGRFFFPMIHSVVVIRLCDNRHKIALVIVGSRFVVKKNRWNERRNENREDLRETEGEKNTGNVRSLLGKKAANREHADTRTTTTRRW